jgi:hypothetical protein
VIPYITNEFFGDFSGAPSETRAFHTRMGDICTMEFSVIPLITPEPNYLDREVELYEHCTAEDLVPPELLSPENNSHRFNLYDLIHFIPVGMFRWGNPELCIPDDYNIVLATDRSFRTHLRTGTSNGATYWPVESPDPEPLLEPGSQYFWKVQTISDGVEGPESEVFTFYTGPYCYSRLPQPVLVAPNNGAEITERFVYLEYETGDDYKCWPDRFYIDIQTDPDAFDSTPPDYYTTLLSDSRNSYKRLSEYYLHDCTTYYWRVANILEGYIGGEFRSGLGPYSDIWSFSIDWSGACSIPMEGGPTAYADSDLPCLEGPDPPTYPTVGYLLAGERAAIIAQSMDRQWWYIDNPDGTDICTVPMERVTVEGDISGLPRFSNPEIEPEESDDGGGGEPSACAGLDFNACSAAGCAWSGNQCTDP